MNSYTNSYTCFAIYLWMEFTYEWVLIYQNDFMSADRPSIKKGYHLSLFSGKRFLKNDLEYSRQGMKDAFSASSSIQKQDGSIAEDLMFNYVVFSI